MKVHLEVLLSVLRDERLAEILKVVEKDNIIKVSDITRKLNVTEMTARRDLNILEKKGIVERIYGGAIKKQNNLFRELSHNEKKSIHVEEKKYIANLAAQIISENDIVYIGEGTTNEFIYDYLSISYAKIITNSISIFSKFRDDKRFELILIGGRFRARTNIFVGNFTNEFLSKIRVNVAFVGTNGICGDNITTSNEEEGACQKIILDNSKEKYVLCDNNKFGKEDFYSFYKLKDITAIITDNNIKPNVKKKYERFTRIINS